MVMIARLSTARGIRAPLGHVANQVFLDLAGSLQSQGVRHKVIADMFGLTLGAYHGKLRRLQSESESRKRSVWENVIRFLESHKTVRRSELMHRFRFEDPLVLGSVLQDLVNSEIGFREDEGGDVIYGLHAPDSFAPPGNLDAEALALSVWVTVHRLGPMTFASLRDHLPMLSETQIKASLETLRKEQRVQKCVEKGAVLYAGTDIFIDGDSDAERIGAMIDHYGAVINTLCRSAEESLKTSERKTARGSTYHFDLNAHHVLRDEVLAFFEHVRKQGAELLERVDAENARHTPNASLNRLVFYCGYHLEELNESEK